MLDSDTYHRSAPEAGRFKQIEDVIDARKELGQYNVHRHPNPLKNRCFCHPLEIHGGVSNISDKDIVVRSTESEITILRVSALSPLKLNKWDGISDMAAPGDGTHLGENPSMVNLATLVTQNIQSEGEEEYLVPLSSWDSFLKDDPAQGLKRSSESKIGEKCWLRSWKTDPTIVVRLESSGSAQNKTPVEAERRRPSWAGKFSKFWRRHWQRSSSFRDPKPPEAKPDDNQNKPQN
ncbi:hypothetical protein D910_05375 [Dendroctonus ponderosae]|uniref:Uncharacterized protein n=1 Tax=Dendroctonus ponderosae TaxID=77166 RepID=U4U4K2_DENPD|nr:hypothetical protein D910_05375 [Dendroctonus ponderosae]KAH1004453.1 hypothetical protein HUJ05_005262 [Dendroctonus ponderosae]